MAATDGNLLVPTGSAHFGECRDRHLFHRDNPQTEDQLIIFLRNKNYDLLIDSSRPTTG